MGLLGFFLTSAEVQQDVATLLGNLLPITGERRLVQELVGGRGISLGLGLLGTLWGVTAIHDALDRAFQGVFGRTGARPFIRDKLTAVGFAGMLALLAVLSFALSFVVELLTEWLRGIGLGQAQRLVLSLISPAFGLAAGFVLFALIYRAIPRRRLPTRSILAGAALAALLWEAAKIAFAVYSRGIGAFRAYGALALAAGLLTWIYLTAIIVLLGAEVIKATFAETEA